MISNLKTKIVAAASVLGLGGLAGIAANSNSGQAEDPSATAGAANPPVHVVHRTVRRTKHYKVKDVPAESKPQGSGSAAAAAPVPAATPVSAPASAPVVTQSSGAPSSSAPPVTTSPSGGAGGGYGEESESESEGDEGGDDD